MLIKLLRQIRGVQFPELLEVLDYLLSEEVDVVVFLLGNLE